MKNKSFMMLSNIVLSLPVVFAGIYQQWLYCFFATGLVIFSPLYHWYKITEPSSFYFKLFKNLDWLFALGAFIYMYFYIYRNLHGFTKIAFSLSLTMVVIFFYYGWKHGQYEKWHPWFHVIAPIISSVILITADK